MPAELWQAAAELARVHGVSPVSQALGLNYTRLKGSVKQGVARTERPECVSAPTFVEVKAKPVEPGEPEYVFELEAPETGTMRIRLKGASTEEVARLAASFWRRGR